MIPMNVRQHNNINILCRIYTSGSEAIGRVRLDNDRLTLCDVMLLSRSIAIELLLETKIED